MSAEAPRVQNLRATQQAQTTPMRIKYKLSSEWTGPLKLMFFNLVKKKTFKLVTFFYCDICQLGSREHVRVQSLSPPPL